MVVGSSSILSQEEKVELHPMLPNIVCEIWGKARET